MNTIEFTLFYLDYVGTNKVNRTPYTGLKTRIKAT